MSSDRPTRWWLEHAWIGDVVEHGVLVQADDGIITSVSSGRARTEADVRLDGFTVPGLANAHSHAFHRALRGRTQQDCGSFWTWRELMYRAAGRLDPDSYLRLARGVYAEMALAGVTAVGEFHYLHHREHGRPYADPNAMGHALVEAASAAGIRLTLLDTCYLSSAPDGSGLQDGPQQRFGDGSGDRWADRVEALHQDLSAAGADRVVVGAALHSVRGVPIEHMPAVVEWAEHHRAPLHVHSSEQPREVSESLAAHGRTPTAVLRDVGALGARTTSVHSTHLTDQDLLDLSTTRTGTCFCPTTERDLGDGVGHAPALLASGALFSLGSDSHAVIDLFEEARAVELDERLARGERGLIGAARLLDAATFDGQQALGWTTAGRLAVGHRADLVTIDLESVRTAGGEPSPETAVFSASAPDVRSVVADGQLIVENGRHRLVEHPAHELRDAILAIMEPRPPSMEVRP